MEEDTNVADGAASAGNMMETWMETAKEYLPNIVAAIVILIAGLIIAKVIRSILRKTLGLRHMPPIVATFIVNIAYVAMMVFVFMAAVNKLGVQTTSFVAVLGAAGLAIGLALQGSLSNFAAGFMLVLFRPFKQGDFVEAGGTAGLVEEIQIFTSVLKTPDNKKVIVPNSSIIGGNITNFSAHEKRRIDWVFGVSYSDDIDKVKKVIREVVEANEKVHKDPEVFIVLSEMADSSVNFTVRAWANTADFWSIYFDVNERMKKAFDAADISIPFPQRDVHLIQESSD